MLIKSQPGEILDYDKKPPSYRRKDYKLTMKITNNDKKRE